MVTASTRAVRSAIIAALAATGICLLVPTAIAAGPAENSESAANYSLVDSPLLPATRWSQPSSLLRLETAAGLAARHEIRLTAFPAAYDPAALSGDSVLRFDAPRATYRYTLMERPSWAWKVGLTSNLRDAGDLFRHGIASERTRFGAMPLMHVGGEARVAERWRLSVDADGLMTARAIT